MKRAMAATVLALAVLTPSKALKASTGTCPAMEPYFRRYGLPVATFSRIAYRESRCDWTSISAVRRSTGWPDVGAVQIQGSWNTVTRRVCHLKPSQSHIRALTKPDCQLKVARFLYLNGGLGHWRGNSTK